MSPERAVKRFEKITGIAFSGDMQLLAYRDDGPGEGEFCVVIKMPAAKVQEILKQDPPMGKAWQDGPINPDIISCWALVYDICDWTHDGKPASGIGGFKSAGALTKSSSIKYCAESYENVGGNPWHSGGVMIVSDDGTVWLSVSFR